MRNVINSETMEPLPQWKEPASSQRGSGNMSCTVIKSLVSSNYE